MAKRLNLEKIKKLVFSKRPVLKEVYTKYGHLTLEEYVQTWEVSKQKPGNEFLSAVYECTKNIYGNPIAKQVKEQIKQKPLISTVDHLGIWGHPIFVNSDAFYSLYFKPKEIPIILATESVSLNNVTSLSGCLLKHDREGQLKKYSFFTDKQKTLPVFSVPGVSKKDLVKMKVKIQGLNPEILGAFTPEVFKLKTFSLQASLISHNLWKKVFPSAPKIVYLPLETILLKYLEKTLLDPKNIFSKLILEKKSQELWKKYFGKEATLMFWGIDSKGKRQLTSQLPSKKEILNAIKKRTLYPSSPLGFMLLLFAGVSCVGGFTQTTWLTEVKEKFVKLLKELGEKEEVFERILKIPTKNFAESSLVKEKFGKVLLTPTSWDLLALGKDIYGKQENVAKKMTLKQSLDMSFPEIYKVVYHKSINKEF